MPKPIILMVDDDIQVLDSVERDLRNHYHSEYRLVKASSGQEALTAAEQIKRRNAPLALFLVDQRMPSMSGTEFLAEAKKLFPDARKVLLTAYADTAAAIASINQIGLDYYLMKPWDPPEQNLYPVLDDLLNDWKASAVLPYDGIRVAGVQWSAGCHTVKDFLSRNQVPYQWLDIEKDAQARQMVEAVNQGEFHLPVIFFPDGSVLVQPSLQALAEKIGLQTRPSQPFYDLAIIGAGPAGLAAAVYAASEGLHTILVEREAAGGQAGTSSRIENYLGFPNGLTGADLSRRAVAQARRFGVELITTEEAATIRPEDTYRYVRLSSGKEISCHALLIATGVTVRRLEAPGIEALTGAGVYYGAALTEANAYKGQDIFIVGGANSAGQAAVYFSRFARTVTILERGNSIRPGMSNYLVSQIEATPNIQVMPNAEVAEATGSQSLETVMVKNRETGVLRSFPVGAMFIFIGATPHTDLVKGIVQTDPAGFILTGPDL
ncbi:MAG TPA: FAD-dependent oxidoreductase, partial [Anaerolineaceae bacterium]|nr:FAD-dependent oxidoreductase [Anaerolineaceae bacterium]